MIDSVKKHLPKIISKKCFVKIIYYNNKYDQFDDEFMIFQPDQIM